MISVKEALGIILKSISPLGNEQVSLLNGLDRIIATDLQAKCDLPPFDNSAMDGYALKTEDTKGATEAHPKILKVIEDVPAGYTARKRVRDNQAIRIMTGAPLPLGADSVVMVEFTKKLRARKGDIEDLIEVHKEVKRGENVRWRAEDVSKGQRVLSRGSLLRPPELGMLAALGIGKIKVVRRPRVGILATGDELVRVKERLTPGKIRNSNSFILNAQITKCGGIAIDLGIAKDTPAKIRGKIRNGLKKDLDILLVLGGVSVGDYDLVKDVLGELGMKMEFWKVAMRPGKPLAFGMISASAQGGCASGAKGKFTSGGNNIPVFGLPGNPVSSTITFEEFVRPSILKMQGAKDLFRPSIRAFLEQDFRKRKNLRYFIRAKLKNKNGKFFACISGPQGSGMLSSLVLADGIIVAPEGEEVLKKGEAVDVQLLRQGYDGGVI